LEEIVTRFLHGKGERVDRSVFAVAGPVMEGVAQLTNLPWVVAEDSLRSALGVPSVHLINDLLAMAQAIPYLPPDALRTLQCGSSAPGARLAVVAPGTGLGEAFLLWDGAHYIAHPSEGGHADFAPADQLQLELLEWLFARLPHVSYECVCSGRGLPTIYEFLRQRAAEPEASALATRIAEAQDSTPVIMEAALAYSAPSPLCAATLELFSAILAAEAGNAVLRVLATGGVYLGGGLPRRMLPVLTRPEFMESFRRKGRLSFLLERVPVHVIVRPNVALLGAAHYALHETAEGEVTFDGEGETLARPPRT
jgi:glucokinase